MTDFDMLCAEIAALSANRHALKKARLLEYVCSSCGSTILEVIQTSRCPAVLGRSAKESKTTTTGVPAVDVPALREHLRRQFKAAHEGRMTVAGWQQITLQLGSLNTNRRGDYQVIPILPELRSAAAGQPVPADLNAGIRLRSETVYLCGCASWPIPLQSVLDDMAAGNRKRTLTPVKPERLTD